jgi:hypothetical protein
VAQRAKNRHEINVIKKYLSRGFEPHVQKEGGWFTVRGYKKEERIRVRELRRAGWSVDVNKAQNDKQFQEPRGRVYGGLGDVLYGCEQQGTPDRCLPLVNLMTTFKLTRRIYLRC